MPQQVCNICKTQFKNKEIINICDHCSEMVSKSVFKNRKLKELIVNRLLEDSDFVSAIANKIFHETNVTEIGLGGAGTVAQFFCKKGKKKTKKRA